MAVAALGGKEFRVMRIVNNMHEIQCFVALFLCLRLAAAELSAPDEEMLYQQANASDMRVLYETGFEEPKPPQMTRYYAGHVPNKVVFLGATAEQAYRGKRSYKMQVRFEAFGADRHGAAYFKLPFAIPRWSDLKMRFHVKMVAPLQKGWSFHGFVGAQAGDHGGDNVNGAKIGEDKGWEVWEVNTNKTLDISDWVEGLGIRFQLSSQPKAFTVTIYLDEVTVTGKLSEVYTRQWQDVYTYFTVTRDRGRFQLAERRLGDMKTYRSRLQALYRPARLPDGTSSLLNEHYEACLKRIKDDFGRLSPKIADIEKALGSGVGTKDVQGEGLRFNADINSPERILNDLGTYVASAQAYPAYCKKFGSEEIVTFVLDPTRSTRILPGGRTGHTEENNYYNWGGKGLEHPQLLPKSKPVPAIPSRIMKAFGCRGTFVPLSFAILPGKQLDGLTFEVDDLHNGDSRILKDAIDIRYVATWWRLMNRKPRLMNEMLLHDPNFVVPSEEQPKNVYKDSRFGSDADELQPVTVTAKTLRQFYITVKVPVDSAAGVYKTIITGKATTGPPFAMQVELEVLPFDLAPTPYAYSFYYRSYLRSDETKKKQGIHSWFKTARQMEAELVNMAEHGCNTLNLYDGDPKQTENGWDFTDLGERLAMAKRAGLTRTPFTWLGHGQAFTPSPDNPAASHTVEETADRLKRFITAVHSFCDSKGYPRPALYGHDEASGEKLRMLKQGYNAISEAGGLVTVACYGNYFDEIGSALSLPIVYGGTQTRKGKLSIRASQRLGYECWIYNTPATNMSASASVYRRRYGLAMWRNGEQGAAPWEYSGMPRQRNGKAYDNNFSGPIYAAAYPTWNGKPIDTIIYEAYREGVYDTRYMATLQNRLKTAKRGKQHTKLVREIEQWLETFSVNDDLQQVRRQMADYIIALSAKSR